MALPDLRYGTAGLGRLLYGGNHRSKEEELTEEEKFGEGDGVRAPANGEGGGVRAPANSGKCSGSGELETAWEESAKERKKERNCSGPLFMGGGGDSGAVSDFPAHDLHDRGWDLFCAASHVALSGAPDPATPRATRPQRLDSGSYAAPRRGNRSDGMLAQKHSSASLRRRDVGWTLAHCLEFIGRSTVEIH